MQGLKDRLNKEIRFNKDQLHQYLSVPQKFEVENVAEEKSVQQEEKQKTSYIDSIPKIL